MIIYYIGNFQVGQPLFKIVKMAHLFKDKLNAHNANLVIDLIFNKGHVYKMYGIALNMFDKISHYVHNVFKGIYWLITFAT
mgnify:CR=1 FL=1